MTNADYIRQLTDEEMFHFLDEFICDQIPPDECGIDRTCVECKMMWLQAPHEE